MAQGIDGTLYGNVFHRNICWQRSYERVESEEVVIALYGSLRNGLYNNRRLNLPNKSDFLGTARISGYALYSLGPYPAVYPAENSSVVAEARRFSGKQQLEVAKSIDYMELFGGYHREYVELEIEQQKIKGFIYVYDEKPETEKIEHGDWARYLKEKELLNEIIKKKMKTHNFLRNSRLLTPSSIEAISVTKIPL